MNDDLLTILANYYKSDKGTVIPNDGMHHGPRLHFTPVYHMFMNDIRNDDLTILEIGVGSGPSLKMWYDYFPKANIHAIDIMDQSIHNNIRVNTHICDQSNRQQLEDLMEKIGKVDIIIDDGSHVIDHQQISLGVLFKYLNPNGQYWIEDLHTSDASVWMGKNLYGYDMSFKPGESTVDVLETYINTKIFNSPFLNYEENNFLNDNIKFMKMFDLPDTMWGKNKLCLIKN